jgi:hypothetical protein
VVLPLVRQPTVLAPPTPVADHDIDDEAVDDQADDHGDDDEDAPQVA